MIEYKDVKTFIGYQMGTNGILRSCRTSHAELKDTWHSIATRLNNEGYPIVNMYKDRKLYTFSVHSIVLETFVGPRPDGMEACHNDGDKQNCRLDNLRWDTPPNNAADKLRHGTSQYGERNNRAKLTEKDILRIFRVRKLGYSAKQIAKWFAVSTTTILRILNRKIWSHIEIPKDLISYSDNSIKIEAFGESKTFKEWVQDIRCLVTYSTLTYRIGKGWEPEKAITFPSKFSKTIKENY